MSIVPVVKYFVEIPLDSYKTKYSKAVYAAQEMFLYDEKSLYANSQYVFARRDFMECDGPARALDLYSYTARD